MNESLTKCLKEEKLSKFCDSLTQLCIMLLAVPEVGAAGWFLLMKLVFYWDLTIEGRSEFLENLMLNCLAESKLCFSFGFCGRAGNF